MRHQQRFAIVSLSECDKLSKHEGWFFAAVAYCAATAFTSRCVRLQQRCFVLDAKPSDHNHLSNETE